jgi:AN1-type zinc finger protein 1
MKEDHDCKNLVPLGARPKDTAQVARESGLAAFEKLKAWGANKRAAAAAATSSKASSSKILPFAKKAPTSVAALNQLKSKAKGDDKIPVEKRIYLHIEASADTTKAKHPTGDHFYSRDYSVGRMLDLAARTLQVENINNHGTSEAEKLRVFHVEGGRLLEFSEKLGAVCQSGNTLVLLRGVGPPVPK